MPGFFLVNLLVGQEREDEDRKLGTEGIKGEPLPEKIPWEGEFTLRSDP